jgi:putative mycofactocin binding protein MftB
MNSKSVFKLAKGVQVRKEVFGLLFYDYRGPRLYFVPSKDLITDSFFDGKQSIDELTDALTTSTPSPRKQVQDQIEKILETLENKGLINGQPVC